MVMTKTQNGLEKIVSKISNTVTTSFINTKSYVSNKTNVVSSYLKQNSPINLKITRRVASLGFLLGGSAMIAAGIGTMAFPGVSLGIYAGIMAVGGLIGGISSLAGIAADGSDTINNFKNYRKAKKIGDIESHNFYKKKSLYSLSSTLLWGGSAAISTMLGLGALNVLSPLIAYAAPVGHLLTTYTSFVGAKTMTYIGLALISPATLLEVGTYLASKFGNAEKKSVTKSNV